MRSQSDNVSMALGPADRQLSVSQLVEKLGCGEAQLRLLALAALGVYFCDGAQLALVSMVSATTGKEFNLTGDQEAYVPMCAMIGVMLGSYFSGYVGDLTGRRPMVVYCFGLSAMMGLLTTMAGSYRTLLHCRLLHGFAMGLGMGPSLVIVSECTPERWRVWMRGGSKIAFELGRVLVAVLAAMDDPSLKQLQWRQLNVWLSVPPLLCFLAALPLLDESPVWLACVGKRDEAQRGFRLMQQRNGAPISDVDYAPPEGSESEPLAFREQLAILFSPTFRLATASATFASVCTCMVMYGDMYAAVHIFPTVSAMPAAWQIVERQMVAVGWVLVMVLFADAVPRRTAMYTSMIIALIACYSFVLGGVHPTPRPLLFEGLFEFGTNIMSMATALAFISIFQFAIETYPPTAASAGSACIIGTGRFGAVIAPLLFEEVRSRTGKWYAFHVMAGSLCGAAALILLLSPALPPFRVRGGAKGLEGGYGAIAKAKGEEQMVLSH